MESIDDPTRPDDKSTQRTSYDYEKLLFLIYISFENFALKLIKFANISFEIFALKLIKFAIFNKCIFLVQPPNLPNTSVEMTQRLGRGLSSRLVVGSNSGQSF